MCVISCVKYVVSGASCPKLCFSYACRPNFHHKYLTLTDPLLSVCEEALISLHTCADRPKILRLELHKNVGGKVWVNVCVHAYVCLHDHVKQSRTVLHALIILQVPFFDLSLLSHSSAGRHSSLQKETTSNEESLSWGTPFLLSQLPLFISPGPDEENTANKYM